MTTSARDAYAETRRSLHGVAEVVLAGPQFRRVGDIRLRVGSGRFTTWTEPTVAVVGDELVHEQGRLPMDGRTYDELARAAGLEATRLDDVYHDGPDVDLSARIVVDRDCALRLLQALSVGDTALRALGGGGEPVLWPEHFDVGTTVGEVNFGVSPGDAYLPDPYAYVGPHQQVAGAFWNAPFGAARPIDDLGGAVEVEAFFREGAAAAAVASQR